MDMSLSKLLELQRVGHDWATGLNWTDTTTGLEKTELDREMDSFEEWKGVEICFSPTKQKTKTKSKNVKKKKTHFGK